MYKLQIITNNHWREFKGGHEVPKKVLEWYDWLEYGSTSDGWICYHGHWSHVSDYMRTPQQSTGGLADWHGYKNDSMSDGTVIRFSEDNETYQIGWFVSVTDNGGE